jgi:hypothetical protein
MLSVRAAAASGPVPGPDYVRGNPVVQSVARGARLRNPSAITLLSAIFSDPAVSVNPLTFHTFESKV